MEENSKLSANELMRLYLTEPFEEDCARFLDLLIENHALPIVGKSLKTKFQHSENGGFYWSAQDFEDLSNESCLKLVEKLVEMRESPETEAIRDFAGYAAVVAYNCWNEFFGRRAPNWKNLKNKIRYAVGKSLEIEIRREQDKIFCGLIKNRQRFTQISADNLVVRIEDEVENFRNADLPDLLFEILEKGNSQIRLNELVSIVARLWAIEDLPDVSLEGFSENGFSFEENQQDSFEMRFKLEQIWQEIRGLPVNQRIALLYNLRDEAGREMLFMIFNAKIATLKEIAETMNLSLENFARLLPLLPLEDKIIAEKMNLTAKQVGNLRKVARENLTRRLEGKPKRKTRPNETKKADDQKLGESNFDPAFGEN